MSIKIVNPSEFSEDMMPILTVSDDMRSLFGLIIRSHTNDVYTHAMEMIRPGYFASQGLFGYKEISAKIFMTKYFRLKFFKFKDLHKDYKKAYVTQIKRELKKPWYKKGYDFAGILGQAFPSHWTRNLNIPFLYYCSERSAMYMNNVLSMYIERFKYPRFPNPSELNLRYENDPHLDYVGHWFSE